MAIEGSPTKFASATIGCRRYHSWFPRQSCTLPVWTVPNAYCVLPGETGGSYSLRVLRRNGLSGDPSRGTSNKSKSVASQVNATVRPSGETLGELSLPGVTVNGYAVDLGDGLAGDVSLVSTTHK